MASTTKRKPAADVAPEPEYDFENWSEADEQKAIEAIKPEIKYIIVERTFVGRFHDGTTVKATLKLSLADVDTLQAEHDNEIDQFRSLIQVVGGDENVEELSKQDIADVAAMAAKYFEVIQRIQGATVPES